MTRLLNWVRDEDTAIASFSLSDQESKFIEP